MADEFFDQGDMEKLKLNITPIVSLGYYVLYYYMSTITIREGVIKKGLFFVDMSANWGGGSIPSPQLK